MAFQRYQAIKLSTEKFHFLYNLPDAIKHVGEMRLLLCGVYEEAGQQFRPHHFKTARRSIIVIDEVVS